MRHGRHPVLLSVLVLLVACGGGASVPDVAESPTGRATPVATATTTTAPAASLDVIDTTVGIRTVDTTTFVDGSDGDPLDVGDTVRTDAVGFGQVFHADGSLTRVDVDSEVTVTALDSTATRVDADITLDVGRVWNRIGEDPDARYEVTTDVGTAAVRGTAFDVDCREDVRDGGCLFAVYGGEVEVAPTADDPVVLVAYEYVFVAADGTIAEQGEIAPDLTTPAFLDGDWVRRNDPLDVAAGFDPIEGLEDAPAPAPLAFGVVYDCGDVGGGATSYYRFYEDGLVLDVSSTGTAADVDGWMVRPEDKAGSTNPSAEYGSGTWTLDGDRLQGSTTENVTVTFDGTVAADGTFTATFTSTNGNVSEDTCVPSA